MIRLKLFLCVLLTGILFAGGENSQTCLKQYSHNVSHFEVLPGFGWDNLRNVEVSRVVAFNYSACQLTADGKYLLPNGVNTLPLKQSKLDQYSDIFHSFTEYTSITAESINKDPGFRMSGAKISGTFSKSFLASKQMQVREKSKVTRAQMKFVKYKVKLQPDTQLSNAFKIAILSIARHVLYTRHEMARYESEMLVRDFGTHVITSIDTGAALVQEDHLKSSYVTSDTTNSEDVLLGASMSLRESTGVGLNFVMANSNSSKILDNYKENRLHSVITTYGGPLYMSANASYSWTSNLETNLVAVDRAGEPIYNFVNIQTLPTVPATILYDVTTYLKNAVRDYYAYNTYRGCTNVDEPQFNSVANLEDGTCNATLADVFFGGIYQTCKVSSNAAGDLCSHLRQNNLQTKKESCPQNFDATKIHSSHFSKTSSQRVCKSCYAFFNCCNDEPTQSSAELESFICTTKTLGISEVRFAGFYSSVVDNIFTNSKTCPQQLTPRLIGDDINICVDHSVTRQLNTTIKFGGMFSCNVGNPLASESQESANPMSCPAGFSQQLAGVIKDCPLYYCIPLGDLPPATTQAELRRPPFNARLKLYPSESGEAVVYDPEKQVWLTELESRELKEEEAAVSLTTGEAAVIAIFVTLAFVIILGVAIYFYRRSQHKFTPKRGGSSTGNTNGGHEDAV
ncbi:hypothetical protein SNE40_006862 [Patella caerulea]|uniref:MACPF domain-containing protein n=1 Tax=Patella caerulea TaxID=87958 RepID=A0AAN8PWP1_PATCE